MGVVESQWAGMEECGCAGVWWGRVSGSRVCRRAGSVLIEQDEWESGGGVGRE